MEQKKINALNKRVGLHALLRSQTGTTYGGNEQCLWLQQTRTRAATQPATGNTEIVEGGEGWCLIFRHTE